MKSKNSRPIDAEEAAWLADVKRVPCVFCDAPPPGEAHHPKQGRHFCTVATCGYCHEARVWRIGGMSEIDAVNETIRRVLRLRAGKQQATAPGFRKARAPKVRGGNLSSPKCLPRKFTQKAVEGI